MYVALHVCMGWYVVFGICCSCACLPVVDMLHVCWIDGSRVCNVGWVVHVAMVCLVLPGVAMLQCGHVLHGCPVVML